MPCDYRILQSPTKEQVKTCLLGDRRAVSTIACGISLHKVSHYSMMIPTRKVFPRQAHLNKIYELL